MTKYEARDHVYPSQEAKTPWSGYANKHTRAFGIGPQQRKPPTAQTDGSKGITRSHCLGRGHTVDNCPCNTYQEWYKKRTNANNSQSSSANFASGEPAPEPPAQSSAQSEVADSARANLAEHSTQSSAQAAADSPPS